MKCLGKDCKYRTEDSLKLKAHQLNCLRYVAYKGGFTPTKATIGRSDQMKERAGGRNVMSIERWSV